MIYVQYIQDLVTNIQKEMSAVINADIVKSMASHLSEKVSQSNGLTKEEVMSKLSSELSELLDQSKKQTRQRKEVPTECLCMARVARDNAPHQCSLRKTVGDFCTAHSKRAQKSMIPLQYDENGHRLGLFFGKVDQPIPWKDNEGRVHIKWNFTDNKSLEEEWNALEATGTLEWAPNATKKRSSTSEKKTKKEKKIKEPKAEKPKGKRVGSAYFLWLNEKNVDGEQSRRAIIKQQLLAEGIEVKTQAPVCKRAGEIWKAMSEDEKRPYREQIDTLKTEASSYLQVQQAPTDPSTDDLATDSGDSSGSEDDEEGEEVNTEPVEGYDGLLRIVQEGHEMHGKVIREDDQTEMVWNEEQDNWVPVDDE